MSDDGSADCGSSRTALLPGGGSAPPGPPKAPRARSPAHTRSRALTPPSHPSATCPDTLSKRFRAFYDGVGAGDGAKPRREARVWRCPLLKPGPFGRVSLSTLPTPAKGEWQRSVDAPVAGSSS
eukprot:15448685-Alexandrium_andersonii.AAC.1